MLLPPELPSLPELDPPEAFPPWMSFMLLSLPELVEEPSSSPDFLRAHAAASVAASGRNFTDAVRSVFFAASPLSPISSGLRWCL